MRVFHYIYVLLGHIICKICLAYWNARDVLSQPKEQSVLFIAHPDDDTLFFHTFIKKNKPYVVLLTCGWSLRRMPCFFKAMKYYGVKYRVYDLEANDKNVMILKRVISRILANRHIKYCVTHNKEGEYGHEMHKRIHDVVISCAKIPVMAPVMRDRIRNFPLDNRSVEEKRHLFLSIYTTEKWVLEQYSLWVMNEKIELLEK